MQYELFNLVTGESYGFFMSRADATRAQCNLSAHHAANSYIVPVPSLTVRRPDA